MSEDDLGAVKCLACHADLPSDWGRSARQPCPKCGSGRLAITIENVERISLHECLEGRFKDSNLSSRKNPRVTFQVGDSYWRDGEKWVKKNRLVDRDRDLYQEVVTDPETGTVIHQCEEPLSEHRGHGSAKRSPSSEERDESE